MEYMDGGDLQRFLRNIKGAHKLSKSSEASLQEVEKLDVASQIAQGLEFLAAKMVLTIIIISILCLSVTKLMKYNHCSLTTNLEYTFNFALDVDLNITEDARIEKFCVMGDMLHAISNSSSTSK